MDAFDYTMQLQVGCPGGCLFCYVPNGSGIVPKTIRGEYGEQWGFVVKNKEKVVNKLIRELNKGTLADKTIYWSGVTDPYASPPAVTHELWQALIATESHLKPRRIAIQSRFHVDRDVEMLAEHVNSTSSSDGGPPVVVSYSIGTDRNDLIAAWEKSTPWFEQRMNVIQNLRARDTCVVATLSPLGLWDELEVALHQLKEWGVPYITTLLFKEGNRGANTPRRFRAYLKEHYPMLMDEGWQAEMATSMRSAYGENRVLVGQAGFASLTKPHLVAPK
ncbi:MAG: hypothetical protein AAF702_44345 [Chloroflexota bacterium]